MRLPKSGALINRKIVFLNAAGTPHLRPAACGMPYCITGQVGDADRLMRASPRCFARIRISMSSVRHEVIHIDTTIIPEPGKLELLITREFEAPRKLVFEAFTKSEHIEKHLTN